MATVAPDHPGELGPFYDIFFPVSIRFNELNLNTIRVLFERLKLGAQFDSATKLFEVRTKEFFMAILTDYEYVSLAENVGFV